MRLHEITS
jgi:hypothetical protein